MLNIVLKFPGTCSICGEPIHKGEVASWDKDNSKVFHLACPGNAPSRKLVWDKESNSFFFLFMYDVLLVSYLKDIAGAIWDSKLRLWRVTNPSPISAKQILDLVERFKFEYDTQTLFQLEALIVEGTRTMLQSMASTSSFEIKGLLGKPYPFQVAGIEFGITHKRVIIADQMGLGKTIQALGITSHLQLYPALIVCPAIVKLNWQREILRWVEGAVVSEVQLLESRTSQPLPVAKFFIINYDILSDWADELVKSKFKIIIFDEVHYAKNESSKRGKAVRRLGESSEYCIGLSGTPVLNRPCELVNPLRAIRRIEDIGGRKFYERRYCQAGKDNFGRWNTSGAANLKELNDRLRSSGILIRRTKADVLPDLPRKLPPSIIPISLSNESEYREAERDLARWLAKQSVEDEDFQQEISILSPLEKVREISRRKATVTARARANEARQRFIALKRLSTEGKFHGVREHANEFLASGEKLVLFGWFVDTQRDLAVQWPHAEHALGPDSPEQRWAAIDAFQNDESKKLLICSLSAIGIGVNLTASHHVGFVELGWTPADHDQAEDRLHRIGQKYPVNVYYYVGENTIENDILDIINRKRVIATGATDGRLVTEDEVIGELGKRLIGRYRNAL